MVRLCAPCCTFFEAAETLDGLLIWNQRTARILGADPETWGGIAPTLYSALALWSIHNASWHPKHAPDTSGWDVADVKVAPRNDNLLLASMDQDVGNELPSPAVKASGRLQELHRGRLFSLAGWSWRDLFHAEKIFKWSRPAWLAGRARFSSGTPFSLSRSQVAPPCCELLPTALPCEGELWRSPLLSEASLLLACSGWRGEAQETFCDMSVALNCSGDHVQKHSSGSQVQYHHQPDASCSSFTFR